MEVSTRSRQIKHDRRVKGGINKPFLDTIGTLDRHIAVRAGVQAAEIRSLIVYSLRSEAEVSISPLWIVRRRAANAYLDDVDLSSG